MQNMFERCFRCSKNITNCCVYMCSDKPFCAVLCRDYYIKIINCEKKCKRSPSQIESRKKPKLE